MIADLTKNRPVDASDILDLKKAKDEIANIRKSAKKYLDSMAVVDENDDVQTGAEVDKETRFAMYDKQDFTKYQKVSYPKDENIKALIYDAIRPNSLFENDEEAELVELIELFKPVSFNAGHHVINQGEKGDKFYVVESGELTIEVKTGKEDSMMVGLYSKGAAFGELALIFDSPRAATVTASTDVKLWALDRTEYRVRIGQIRYNQREEKLNFIRKCKIRGRNFCDLFDGSQIEDLSIAVKMDKYKKGSVVIRQGEINDTLYIVRSGTVDRFKKDNDTKIGSVTEGQAFGTNALLKAEPSEETFKAATDLVVYYLTHNDFENMVGTMEDVLEGRSISRSIMKSSSKRTFKTSMTMDQRYTDVTLDDLDFFNVLGRGAFGKG